MGGCEMLTTYFYNVGYRTISILESIGRASIALFSAIFSKPDFVHGPARLIAQLFSVGVLSLVIIIISGLFIGMVLGLQGYTILSRFGADQALGD